MSKELGHDHSPVLAAPRLGLLSLRLYISGQALGHSREAAPLGRWSHPVPGRGSKERRIREVSPKVHSKTYQMSREQGL